MAELQQIGLPMGSGWVSLTHVQGSLKLAMTLWQSGTFQNICYFSINSGDLCDEQQYFCHTRTNCNELQHPCKILPWIRIFAVYWKTLTVWPRLYRALWRWQNDVSRSPSTWLHSVIEKMLALWSDYCWVVHSLFHIMYAICKHIVHPWVYKPFSFTNHTWLYKYPFFPHGNYTDSWCKIPWMTQNHEFLPNVFRYYCHIILTI